MAFAKASSIILPAMLLIQSSFGQDDFSLPADIVGCEELGCTAGSNSSTSLCTLVNVTLNQVGMARVPDASIPGLSWVEGVEQEIVEGGANWTTNFYLATPPHQESLDDVEVGGCALFFTNVSNVSFGDQYVGDAEGTCEEAMSRECVNALVERAREVDTKKRASEFDGPCDTLRKEFESNFDEACSEFAFGEGSWSGLRAVDLTEVSKIEGAANETSNCWPTEPRSYDLSLVRSTTELDDIYVDTLYEQLYGVHPILTLFWPRDEDEENTVVAEQEAQLTCMKTVEGLTGNEGEEPSAAQTICNPALGVLFFVTGIFTLL